MHRIENGRDLELEHGGPFDWLKGSATVVSCATDYLAHVSCRPETVITGRSLLWIRR